MLSVLCLYLALFFSATGAGALLAQTVVNPDISAVGDARLIMRNSSAASMIRTRKATLEFEELELVFTGYLNPYARADVFLSTSGEETEIEEASTTVLRGLPLALQIKAGRYLLDVGRINSQHPHQWSWLERPLMHRAFLGEEGAGAVGLQASTMRPVGDRALTFTVNLFSADFFAGTDSLGPAGLGLSSRLSLFSSLGEFTSLDAGISYLAAPYNPDQDLLAQVGAIDFKAKWRPDMYRAFMVVMEAMASRREKPSSGSTDALGVFASAGWKWRRRYDAGLFFDYSQQPMEPDQDARAFGLYFGFMPVEETSRFSIIWRRETADFHRGIRSSLTLQILWSLGPHKPHSF